MYWDVEGKAGGGPGFQARCATRRQPRESAGKHPLQRSRQKGEGTHAKATATTGTELIIRNRLLHFGFLIFRVFRIYPQEFSFKPYLADAN